MNNVTSLMNAAALDQTGQMMQKVQKYMNIDELMGWMSDAYGYDSNSLKANSKKDEIKEKNIDLMDKMTKLLSINTQNVPENQGQAPTTQTPVPTTPANQGLGGNVGSAPQTGSVSEQSAITNAG